MIAYLLPSILYANFYGVMAREKKTSFQQSLEMIPRVSEVESYRKSVPDGKSCTEARFGTNSGMSALRDREEAGARYKVDWTRIIR